MKFPARFYSLILLFIFIIGFIFIFPQKTLAGTFGFDLQKYIDVRIKNNEIEESSKGEEIRVNTEGVTAFAVPNYIAAGADLLIPLDPNLNPEQVRAVPALAQVMTKLYEYPPASAMAYTDDLLHNAGLIAKPAYAQGIGFAGLSPLLPLWKASRNISYAILIIVMIAIGFMVIFRMKIDPKTVISVQAAIPKIIMALVIITFSYPVAGFFIDVMYLSILIVVEILSKAVPPDLPPWAGFMTETATQQQAFVQSGMVGWGNLFTSVFSFGLLPAFFGQFFGGSFANLGAGAALAAIITIITHNIAAGAFAVILGPAGVIGILAIPVILLLLLGLGLLFTFIRLTFLLINSYIQLLITVILGPLLLLREAVPGQSAFGDWIKNIVANLVVFPATVAVIYFSWIITAVTWNSQLWGAPFIPVGGGGDNPWGKGNPVSVFIGLGIMFLAPNLVASVKKVFGAKPTIPVTAGSAFSPLTGAVQTGMGTMSQFYYMNQVFGGEPDAIARGTLGPIISGIKNVFGRGRK